MRAIGGFIFLVLAAGCSGGSTASDAGPADSGPPPSDFTMQFSLDRTVRTDPNLTMPLIGNVYGAIYRSQDVTFAGPNDGGQSVADVEVDDVNLEDADAGLSTQVWTSPNLPPGDYTFLGYFDVNGDAGNDVGEPSPGDPVTLPTTNSVTIPDGGGTRFLNGQFNLVYTSGL